MSDVVIVGAGIGGAVLALGLGSRGWKVKLLEREAQPPRMARPEILWGATPAALDRYAVGDLIRTHASVRLTGVEMRRGDRRLLALTSSNFQAARVEAYSTDPGKTRELIAEAAAATGNVVFQRAVQVKDVVREGNRIVGVTASSAETTFEERARLIVGDDGAQSIVRGAILSEQEQLRLNLFPVDFITAEIAWPDQLHADQVRLWLNPAAFRSGIPAIGCFPWPLGRGVVLVPLPHDRAVALLEGTADAFWAELARLTPLADRLSKQLTFPNDFHRVRRPYGHAPRYVTDGAAILGDAAHPVSPAGGQGANASIWDALALAEVADEALKANDLSGERLARYETLRRPRNRNSVRITERVVQAFGTAGYVPGLRWLAPALLRCFDMLPPLKARLLSTFANLFVTR